MDFLGVITDVDGDRWMEAIRSHSHPAFGEATLERRYNPFTKQTVDYPISVQLIVDGRVAGSMGWSLETGANEIEVYGPAEVVGRVAEEIAALLGATFRRGARTNSVVE